jgi:hypothetical protein
MKTPPLFFSKEAVVEAYELATDPESNAPFVVIKQLIGRTASDALKQLPYPSMQRVREIVLNEAPDLQQAYERAYTNMQARMIPNLTMASILPTTYETMSHVAGEGYAEYRLDNTGLIETLGAYTVLGGGTYINAVRYPHAFSARQIVNEMDDTELALLEFREQQRTDHTEWEDSKTGVIKGDQVLVPGMPRPTLYATQSPHVDSYLLRQVWLAHLPVESTMDLLEAAKTPHPGRLDHRSF